MRKPMLNSWKDCTDSRKVEKFARASGLEIREAAGSHKMMKCGEYRMTFYEGDISTGVACKIWKWFKTIGVLTLIGLAIYLSAAFA